MELSIATKSSFTGKTCFIITQLSHYGPNIAVRLQNDEDIAALEAHGFEKQQNASMYTCKAELAYNVRSL